MLAFLKLKTQQETFYAILHQKNNNSNKNALIKLAEIFCRLINLLYLWNNFLKSRNNDLQKNEKFLTLAYCCKCISS